jgi:hypothetical protein
MGRNISRLFLHQHRWQRTWLRPNSELAGKQIETLGHPQGESCQSPVVAIARIPRRKGANLSAAASKEHGRNRLGAPPPDTMVFYAAGNGRHTIFLEIWSRCT